MTHEHEPFYLWDPASGEVLKPVDLLADAAQLTDDDLLQVLTAAEALQRDLAQSVQQLRATLLHRMTAREAVLLVTPRFRVNLSAQRTYEYDLPKLMTLRPLLTGEQFEKAFKTTVTPNKTELNKLVKLGGTIRLIIEASVREVEKPPKIEITTAPPLVEG